MAYILSIFFLITGLLLTDAQAALCQQSKAEDTYFRGFYHGRNVFIRNPYLEPEKEFCIQSIYLNGKKVADAPNMSAYELPMDNLNLDDRVVIRIVHHRSCSPQLINPEVIQEDLTFSWVKLYVNSESIIWVTTKEDASSKYIIQKELEGEWLPVDTVAAKGNIFINQHSLELEHKKGENNYRIIYLNDQGELNISDPFFFFSDKREISHAVDTDNWTIEFTEEVSYQLLNETGRIILRGKSVSVDLKRLPRGSYFIQYEGTEHPFEK